MSVWIGPNFYVPPQLLVEKYLALFELKTLELRQILPQEPPMHLLQKLLMHISFTTPSPIGKHNSSVKERNHLFNPHNTPSFERIKRGRLLDMLAHGENGL